MVYRGWLSGILLIATPAISEVLRFPTGEQFSELYILGPEHMAENYPFNIVVGQNYSLYVGVGNHMSSSIYYVLYVKIRNQTELLPNATHGEPSPLQPLFEYRFLIQNGKSWESQLTFSISNASISQNQSLIKKLVINGFVFDVNKIAGWDVNNTSFYYQLFFELWTYNKQSDAVTFINRFVDLQLNLTRNEQSSILR